jgi:hypothetical protein
LLFFAVLIHKLFFLFSQKSNPNFSICPLDPEVVGANPKLHPLYGFEQAAVSADAPGLSGIGLGIANEGSYKDISLNYRDLYCRRCMIFCCAEHPISQPLPRLRVDPAPPRECAVPGLCYPADMIRYTK